MSGGGAGFELVTLRNGARAVRDRSSGEVMHPSVGPWAEANLLYVEQLGLRARLERPGPPLRVLDVGLGAGSNAAAAIEAARELGGARRRGLEVHSFERDLSALALALSDPDGFAHLQPLRDAASTLLERGQWRSGELSWTLHRGDVLELLPAAPEAELVFFDPFSPKANPELWTRAALSRVRERCGPDALLATYSAATPTRVSMLLAGFCVGVGAAVGTKQETTVAARRLEDLRAPLSGRWLERWERSTSRAPWGEPLTAELEQALREHLQFSPLSPR